MTVSKPQPRDFTTLFNRFMYGAMILLGFYYLALNKDVGAAMSTLGIGLIFDPFKQEVSWHKRPKYQKAILIAHLIAVFGLLGVLVFQWI